MKKDKAATEEKGPQSLGINAFAKQTCLSKTLTDSYFEE
jgi:hypothetical protein